MAAESTRFKDVFFKPAFINEFTDALAVNIKGFDKRKFQKNVFNDTWKDKELKTARQPPGSGTGRYIAGGFPRCCPYHNGYRQLSATAGSERRRLWLYVPA